MLLLVGLANLPAAHAQSRCRPAVVLTGDVSLIAAITPALHVRRLAGPDAGCPAARVAISRTDHAIVLSIVDVYQRHSERHVGDPATAAALIESFAIPDELADPPGREPARRRRTSPAAPPVLSGAGGDAELPDRLMAPVSPAELRGMLVLTSETSVASDRSTWLGVRAAVCVRVGAACLGGIARFQRDTDASGDTEATDPTRWGTDLILTADLPLDHDRVTVTPGVGAGVGWMRTFRDVRANTVEANAGGLRTEAHVAASMLLGDLLRVRLGLALDFAPFAHSHPFPHRMKMAPGEPPAFARFELGFELAQ